MKFVIRRLNSGTNDLPDLEASRFQLLNCFENETFLLVFSTDTTLPFVSQFWKPAAPAIGSKPPKKDADVEKSSTWDKRPRQHRHQEQALSSPAPGCGAPPSSSQNYVGASFDRPRLPDVQAEMSAASPVGFRCSVVQSGVAQPTSSGVGDGATGGWGGGQFQAVPASSLQ